MQENKTRTRRMNEIRDATMDPRINTLWAIEDDWNGYGETAPNALAILLAAELLRRLEALGVEPTKVVRSAPGAVFFRLGGLTHYGHIEVFNDGEIVACAQRNDPHAWAVELGDLEGTIKRMQNLWNGVPE